MNDAVETGLKRTAELSAIFMIGNGVLGLLAPREHLDLWRSDVAAVARSRMVRPPRRTVIPVKLSMPRP